MADGACELRFSFLKSTIVYGRVGFYVPCWCWSSAALHTRVKASLASA